MFSTITNASFLTHSKVLSYEFINWVTQGVFVGARFVYMTNHLDDLFLANSLWDPVSNQTIDNNTYRLTSADVTNAVSKQKAFRTAHPTAGATFKLDFAFNGAGAVKDPAAATLALNTTDGLVKAFMTYKNEFRYLNHTFTHADMDGQPTTPPPANVACDYEIHTQAEIEDEINKNQTVWGLMGLPEKTENIRIMVSGNHSGLRNRNCTDYAELHPEMFNVQEDDTPFVKGANPLFIKAAANAGIEYIASDTSQLNQGTEQYITNAMIDDGKPTDRLLLPRYPTSVFYNVYTPAAMTDEYNYMFHDRYVAVGQNPCTIPAALCTPRTYNEILVAEATAAVQHMLTYNKFAHFFHQMNVAKYNTAGNTLQFDWLNAVYTAYEKLFKLPVKNPSYYQLGDMTRDRLIAKSAVINAKWNRATNQVTLSANKNVPNLLVTGIASGELYGGQSLRKINVTTTPQTIAVDQKLTQ